MCNQYIFKVEIIGNNPSTTKLVNEVLNENGVGVEVGKSICIN
ncbi:MAG: hypothetical protein ACLTAI_09685 [Thomasclavelia sp.]